MLIFLLNSSSGWFGSAFSRSSKLDLHHDGDFLAAKSYLERWESLKSWSDCKTTNIFYEHFHVSEFRFRFKSCNDNKWTTKRMKDGNKKEILHKRSSDSIVFIEVKPITNIYRKNKRKLTTNARTLLLTLKFSSTNPTKPLM